MSLAGAYAGGFYAGSVGAATAPGASSTTPPGLPVVIRPETATIKRHTTAAITPAASSATARADRTSATVTIRAGAAALIPSDPSAELDPGHTLTVTGTRSSAELASTVTASSMLVTTRHAEILRDPVLPRQGHPETNAAPVPGQVATGVKPTETKARTR